MFDLGWAELILIGIVALIVMGDDFPSMFRTLGRFTGKMRKMAREFTRAMEEAADDAGVKDVSNTLKSATSPKSMGLDALNRAANNFEKWEAGTQRKASPKPKPKPGATKPAGAQPDEAASKPAESPDPEPAAEPADTAPAAERGT